MRLIAITAAVLLTACHTVPEVVSVGPDTYMVGANGDRAEGRAQAVNAANAYCADKGKLMVMRSMEFHGSVYNPGANPSVIFACLNKDDPAR